VEEQHAEIALLEELPFCGLEIESPIQETQVETYQLAGGIIRR